MKTLIQILSTYFLILAFSYNLSAQEIQIDVTFTSDTVIYPFDGIDKITELSMEGSITLNNNTSLVRVILQDDFGFEYMVFESYALICPGLSRSVKEYCDETCAIDQVNPVSLIIQLIDANLTLESLYYSNLEKQDAEQIRYTAKRAKDAEKIQLMNTQIPAYGMNWTAGDNDIVSKYYDEKRWMFGDKYNILGFDYYRGGVFEFLGHSEYPNVDPDLVRQFDWRDRHGANNPTSKYWDGDIYGTGWLTSVKDQGNHGTCWAFSAVGQLEAVANLFANDTLDFDQSEREIVFCVEGNCNGGNSVDALNYFKNPGVIPETCFPYELIDCANDVCPQKCVPPNINLKISDYKVVDESNYDSVRLALINSGPLSIGYVLPNTTRENHSVILCGYYFNNYDSSCTWIIKNSWGIEDDWGVNGFCNLKTDHLIDNTVGAIETPVTANNTVLSVNCYDKDGDSLCFWGIGARPSNCPCQGDTIEDCDDNNPFLGGYDENYNCRCNLEFDTVSLHITSDTTWSDTTYVNYQVIIDSGACLTINSYTAFVPEAGIRVEQSGKLILDSAYLTKVCPDLWKGIDVLGSDTIQALDQYFGKVVVRNNSIIEFAEVGIANHCRTCGYQDMQCGGIISAENSIFRDNERDILLNPFSTYWFNHDLPYACVISNCRFITTDNFYPEHVPQAHIEMKDIYGLLIYGSRFGNQSDTANRFPVRGTGISSIDSYFMINRYCLTPGISPCEDFDTCKFSHLEYGIKAMNSRTKRTLNIQGLQFDTNLVAISLSGIENAAVLSNEFNLPKNLTGVTPDRFAGGLFMEGCTGYHVEDNSFIGETQPMVGRSPANGIGVKVSGPENNEIYNNDFQKVNIGIISIGENRGRESGLCLKCNDMYSNLNDFLVVDENYPPLGTYQGINRYQGNPVDSTSFDAPAGNVFSNDLGTADSLLITNYNYYNSAEDIYYTHHYHQDIQVRPMEDNYTSSTIELKGWTTLGYLKATACPSGLGGGGSFKSYFSPMSVIDEADIQLDILKSQFEELVDGGNTEGLNYEVMTSLPDEGLEIRQELLSTSPYLSDTVLKQAIYKEDVLPNAMIRDVLKANPQSAKSDEILNTLNSRYEPMPDYMMAQIMGGKNFLGAKEEFEAKIQSWEQIRSKAKADLMREFLLDTNMISPLDSIITFLESEIDLNSKYDLALAQWDNSDLEGAWFTLDAIPAQFTLDEKQSIDHENYMKYFGLLQTQSDSNWQANQLDSTSVSSLYEIKDSGNPRIAALSRGLLVKGGFFKYIETINFPVIAKSSDIPPVKNNENPTTNKEDKLWIFPNPASDYVIAYYNLELKYKSGEIHLLDMKGNVLRSFPIICGKDQIVIDLKYYPVGFYMVSLYSKYQILDSKKLGKGWN
jgi:hypothetical protein